MLALLCPLLGVTSCGFLKKGGAGDASADADVTAAADAASTTVAASNEADLTHPADEAKIDRRAHAMVALTDGGAKDAGWNVVAADAAAALRPPSVASVPTAPPGSVEVAPTGGACPADFALGRDIQCHKNCASGPSVCKLARCSSNCGTSGPVCVSPLSACAR